MAVPFESQYWRDLTCKTLRQAFQINATRHWRMDDGVAIRRKGAKIIAELLQKNNFLTPQKNQTWGKH
jgi:hypothetical protein